MGLSVLRQFLPHGLSATAAVILKKLEAGHILVTASKKREYAPDFISLKRQESLRPDAALFLFNGGATVS